MNRWQEKALTDLEEISKCFDVSMAELTTFKIGGPLDLLVEPGNAEELQRVLRFCNAEKVSWMLLGLGSNLLVRDKGIRGVGIKLTGEFLNYEVQGEEIMVGAGMALSELAKASACLGLTGLEFACGIPGTVGGAVFMNAGAYDGEISNGLKKVEAVKPDGTIVWYNHQELKLSYRHSIFQENHQVVIKLVLKLQLAQKQEVSAKIAELTCRRESKQPLEMPSAGSVFRRPKGYFVGPLIEEAGLKGYSIGGAQISPKHAGFIVNTGGATARDVLGLISHIQQVIREKYGVELVPEIRVVGEE